MMNDNLPETRKQNEEAEESRISQQVNWWGILGLLCVMASAYLSIRVITEILSLLGSSP